MWNTPYSCAEITATLLMGDEVKIVPFYCTLFSRLCLTKEPAIIDIVIDIDFRLLPSIEAMLAQGAVRPP
jgi:hypothetical protein